jgi:carboxyl-terminal processing protease
LSHPLAESERATTGAVRRWLAMPLIISFCLLIGFSGGFLIREGDPLTISAGASSSLIDHPDADVLFETWDLIQNRYVDQSMTEERALIYGASAGMVEALGDTGHSTFLTPEESEAFRSAMRGELIGIGVHLEYVDGRPVIVATVEGSPAEEAGIRAGDVITSIDGTRTDDLSDIEISRMIRGQEGTELTLGIERPSDSAEQEVVLERRLITIDPVSWAMLPDDIVLIRIREFSTGSAEALASALAEAEAAGAKGIVLDLRNNPGGLVHELVSSASLFLPEGSTIYVEEDQAGNQRAVPTRGVSDPIVDTPISVLINRGSASSAEILAAALLENDRAVVLGEQTYGTGTVLTPFSLEDGSTVLLGTALWLTPEGNVIWKQGVEPPIEVQLEPGVRPISFTKGEKLMRAAILESQDAQLERAIQELGLSTDVSPLKAPAPPGGREERSALYADSEWVGYTRTRV